MNISAYNISDASEVSDEFKKKIETAPKAIKNLFVEKNEIMLHIIFFQKGFLEGIKKTHQIKSMKKLSLFLSVLILAVKITLETLFEHEDNPRPVESRKALLHKINDLEKCTQYISA